MEAATSKDTKKKSSSKRQSVSQQASSTRKAVFDSIDVKADSDEIVFLKQAIESNKAVYLGHDKLKANENIRFGEIDVNETSFHNLKQSISSQGLLQNLVAEFRQIDHEKYDLVLVAGHRRLKALQSLNYQHKIPVNLVLGKSKRLALTENVNRKNLHFLEVARTYRSLKEEGMEIDEITSIYEKDKKTVSRYLKMANWPDDIHQLIFENGKILTFNYIWTNFVLKAKSDSEIRRQIKSKLAKSSETKTKKDPKAQRNDKLIDYMTKKQLSEEQRETIISAFKYFKLI